MFKLIDRYPFAFFLVATSIITFIIVMCLWLLQVPVQ